MYLSRQRYCTARTDEPGPGPLDIISSNLLSFLPTKADIFSRFCHLFFPVTMEEKGGAYQSLLSSLPPLQSCSICCYTSSLVILFVVIFGSWHIIMARPSSHKERACIGSWIVKLTHLLLSCREKRYHIYFSMLKKRRVQWFILSSIYSNRKKKTILQLK